MSDLVISLVLRVLLFFFTREVVSKHPLVQALKADPNPPLSQLNNPNFSNKERGEY